MNGTRMRLVSLLGATLLALTAVAPASASTNVSQSGKVGAYQVNDQNTLPGVRCIYETHKEGGAYQLDKLRVRAPFVHSYIHKSQWVGWRYIVKRDTNFDNVFGEVYRSPIVKAKATQSTIAPFSDRVWTSGEHPKGNYQVWIVLFWYGHANKTSVSGKVVEVLDYYAVRGGGPDTVRMTDCYKEN
jgi:hypothetical protein